MDCFVISDYTKCLYGSDNRYLIAWVKGFHFNLNFYWSIQLGDKLCHIFVVDVQLVGHEVCPQTSGIL